MKLLLIEDDRKIVAYVKRGLEAEGFTVDVAFDGIDGGWMASEGSYDLIVLDIMLPGRNGYLVCSDLRTRGDWTPVLMLTAKDGDLDEAEALDTGADDYLTKPFSFAVLTARIRALVRRSTGGSPPPLGSGRPTNRSRSTKGLARRDRDRAHCSPIRRARVPRTAGRTGDVQKGDPQGRVGVRFRRRRQRG